MKKRFLFLVISALVLEFSLYSQNDKVKMGIVGDKFTDFTLQTYQGKQISTKNLRGKNILLIVSRGKYKDNAWCTLCQYQYADFAELELTKKIRDKYNMEIIFLLPYSKDTIAVWEKIFPEEIKKIEEWKNPGDPDKISEGQRSWMEFVRAHYPKKFDFTGKKVPLPLPIAIDDKQEVSKGLDLSRTEWSGTKTLQNIPAMYVIDKEGIIKFKYVSQSTVDRPSAEYILDFIGKMK